MDNSILGRKNEAQGPEVEISASTELEGSTENSILAVTYPESPACKFPFIYEGKAFTTCTEYGSTDKTPWCATTSNYDRDRKWKPCAVKEYGGNSNGAPCTFPFIYLGRTYYTCTNKFEHKGRYWCATTGSYDKDRKWSFCADIKLSVNYPEDPCRFPFTYKGKTYSGCTGAGREDGKLWCSISKNHDDNSQLVFCEPSDPAPCYFPFKYKKKSYSDCTMNGSFDGHLWCATTADYDKDSKWKACITEEYGGNSNGGQCVFPFTYMDKEYTTCTNEDTDGRFWCATTANYDKDKKWSFCADTRMSNGEIVKPDLETQNQLQSNEEKQTINISKCCPAELFRVVHGLIYPGPKKVPVPPLVACCDDFAQHFKEKIAQIRHELDSTIDSDL
ncbi:Matrix metalloproteinase-9 [Varanus komodoensis]|nr:Matrix metalloproteinase-9 [Varanus komodoensis]